jgi:ATP-dependent protease ClpP protease subunit
MRFLTKDSFVSIGQLSADYTGHSSLPDTQRLMERIKIDNNRVLKIIAQCTGKNISQVKVDLEHRLYMTSTQAKKYGLVDKIVKNHKNKRV